MVSVLQQRATTIVGLLVTAVLSLLSFLFPLSPEARWLTIVVGTTITLTTTVLEMRLADMTSKEMGRRFEIYSLLERIEQDTNLRQRAMTIVDSCKKELQNLARGIITLSRDEFITYITEKVRSCRRGQEVLAIHIALEPADMEMWEDDPGVANYFQANVEARKRGVHIVRVFILKKAMLISQSTGEVTNPRIIEILKKHKRAELGVIILWDEDLKDLSDDIRRQEFMVFGNEEVQINPVRLHGTYFSLTSIRKRSDIEAYTKRHEHLASRGKPLERVLKEINVPMDMPDRSGKGPLS